MDLRPVWSVINTAGIENFPLLPGVEGLHVFAENDANGASNRAVNACALRWHQAGRKILIAAPDFGVDLNDEIQGAMK
jgi:hypothetical protein